MKKQIDVSICIVSFNTREHLKKCLRSIYRFTKHINFEIIVVDNGSKDGSTEMVEEEFPNIQLIKNLRNKWFSGANNQALRQDFDGELSRTARSTYIFFLNPDTWMTSNVVKNLKEWMDQHIDAGACEPRQIGANGIVAPTGSKLNKWWIDLVELTELSHFFGSVGRVGIWKKPEVIKKFREEGKAREKNWQTEVISGAALFARTEIIKQVGGFDEKLKLYYTDTDLCRKLLARGWKIWHVGQQTLYHSLSVATSKLSWERRSRIYAEDARAYYSITGKSIHGMFLYCVLYINTLFISMKNQVSK